MAIPGHGKNKINAAFAFGGPQLLTQTVEQATGLRIDAYVELGFGGFVSVIDALGGIEMCPQGCDQGPLLPPGHPRRLPEHGRCDRTRLRPDAVLRSPSVMWAG